MTPLLWKSSQPSRKSRQHRVSGWHACCYCQAFLHSFKQLWSGSYNNGTSKLPVFLDLGLVTRLSTISSSLPRTSSWFSTHLARTTGLVTTRTFCLPLCLFVYHSYYAASSSPEKRAPWTLPRSQDPTSCYRAWYWGFVQMTHNSHRHIPHLHTNTHSPLPFQSLV